MAQPPSNEDFVRDLMRFGNPLKQAVIMEAIQRYAKEVAETFDPAKAEGGVWNLIHPESWKAAATEIHQACEKRLGR